MPPSMSHLLRQNSVHIAIVSVVFLFFACNAAGLVVFKLDAVHGIDLRLGRVAAGGEFGLPDVMRSSQFLVLLLSGALLCLVLPVLSPIPSSLLTAAAVAPTVYLGLEKPQGSLTLPMEFGILTLGVIYTLNLLLGFYRETRSKRQILSVFGQYIPPQLVADLSRHPREISLDAESRSMTVLFCDLQNFTGVAEGLNPKQITLLLNEYFTSMTDVLFRYGATIDKYIGDSIMTFWGAPLMIEDHAKRAVLASFDMHRAIGQLAETFARRGWPSLNMGVGINSGMMNVGNMGSKYRLAYTVVGDAVNLAARVEGLTRLYCVPTIVSESTRQDCSDVVFRTLDVVRVRGRQNATRIYQPLCLQRELSDSLRAQLALHERGVESYINGDLASAKVCFEELWEIAPKDGYYPVMLHMIDLRSETASRRE